MSSRRTLIGALILVAILSLAAGRTLLAPGFYDAHDNLLNVHRVFELEKCLADGQLPCRWVPDMGAGHGYPLFNFYPSLPSFVALGFRTLGFSHLEAVKLSMLLAIAGAGLAMFAMSRELLGERGAAVASVFYAWAPYRAVDVFVRGALAEALALALLPLAFWTAHRLLTRGDTARWSLASALVWAALLQTHHGVCLMSAPIYAAWCGLWLARERRLDRLPAFAAAHGAAFALAAWFVLPALVERGEVHLDSLRSLYAWSRYEANFLAPWQALFGTLPWGYGAYRIPGGMSLFAGIPLWSVATAAGLAAVALWWRSRGPMSDATAASALLLGCGWAALAMSLEGSKPVWDALPALAYLQFPWRYLGVAVLGLAFATGAAVVAAEQAGLGNAAKSVLAGSLIALAVAASWPYFRPAAMHAVANDALANAQQVRSSQHGLYDFMPAAVDLKRFAEAAPGPVLSPGEIIRGNGEILAAEAGTSWIRLTVRADDEAVLRINRFVFPGWVARVDDARTPLLDEPDPIGRLHLHLDPGLHRVEARLENTPVRRLANGLSLASGIGFLIACGWVAWRGQRAERNPAQPR